MIFNAVFCSLYEEIDFSDSSPSFDQFEAAGWVDAVAIALCKAKNLGMLLDSLEVEDFDDATGFDLP